MFGFVEASDALEYVAMKAVSFARIAVNIGSVVQIAK
jgi:hypothetical protein